MQADAGRQSGDMAELQNQFNISCYFSCAAYIPGLEAGHPAQHHASQVLPLPATGRMKASVKVLPCSRDLSTCLLHTPCQEATGPPGHMDRVLPKGVLSSTQAEGERSQKSLARLHHRALTTEAQKADLTQWAVDRLGARVLTSPGPLKGKQDLSEPEAHLEKD